MTLSGSLVAPYITLGVVLNKPSATGIRFWDVLLAFGRAMDVVDKIKLYLPWCLLLPFMSFLLCVDGNQVARDDPKFWAVVEVMH